MTKKFAELDPAMKFQLFGRPYMKITQPYDSHWNAVNLEAGCIAYISGSADVEVTE